MSPSFALGLDFGTNSVRALLVDVASGREIATAVHDYSRGDSGVILDPSNPNLARQHPADYVEGLTAATLAAVRIASSDKDFSPADVIGIGIDTTGSTPLPIDASGAPLAFDPAFADNPAAMAWLWKDHTAHAEAASLTAAAAASRPQYLAKCGGTYSSEWFWSKILHCARTAPEVFAAAFTWVECADYIPALLTGTTDPAVLKRGICAAGHKGLFNPSWGGYPDAEFLSFVDPALARIRETLPGKAYNVSDPAGLLTPEWAERLFLPAGIPVAVGAFDAHLGAVGSGVAPGVLVKIIGTSTCDVAVWPLSADLPDIPGLCGIVPESVLPGMYGLEAGQSAVGDIFNWFVNYVKPSDAPCHEALTAAAESLSPGHSGLIALDWHNGNRTILVDQRLTGLILGMTLHTTPPEIYRALIEATAFGARVIIERFQEFGVSVDRVVNCGGISVKNPLAMQIYADVINRPMEISRSGETCALGAAIAGTVVAGKSAGGYDDFTSACAAMTAVRDDRFLPDPARAAVYEKLYQLYRRLHDAFGATGNDSPVHDVMKQLLQIRDEVRA